MPVYVMTSASAAVESRTLAFPPFVVARVRTAPMAAPAATTTLKKASRFRIERAATPQGVKRNNVADTGVKGAAPEIPKASNVTSIVGGTLVSPKSSAGVSQDLVLFLNVR